MGDHSSRKQQTHFGSDEVGKTPLWLVRGRVGGLEGTVKGDIKREPTFLASIY